MSLRRLAALGVLAVALASAGCGDSTASSSGPAGSAAKTAAAPLDLTGVIAFRRYFTSDESWGAVFTVSADGAPRQITDPPRGVVDEFPVWSPDGTLIAFTRCSPDALCHIYRVAPDGSGLAPIGPLCPDGADEHTCSDDGNPTFSPDSRRVVFTQSTGRVKLDSTGENWIEHSALAIMRTDGSKRRVIYRGAPFSGDIVPAAFSSNGHRLVIEQANSGFSNRPRTRAVVVIRIDGSSRRRLTDWAENAGDHPAWSPDGSWILFHSHVEDGAQGQYFIVHPDGSGRRQLTHFADGTWIGRASFSPSGESIVFAKGPEGGTAAVYTMGLDGSHVQQVTHSEYWDSAPAWGPAAP